MGIAVQYDSRRCEQPPWSVWCSVAASSLSEGTSVTVLRTSTTGVRKIQGQKRRARDANCVENSDSPGPFDPIDFIEDVFDY